jgi:hypothetical protein
MVDGTRLGSVCTGKILEIKAFLGQLLSAGKAFPVGIHLLQYRVVARKDSIDFPYHIDLFVGLFVVVAVAARVAAKLLVDATDDRFTAVEAFSFFHSYQLFSCLVIQLFSCFWLLATGFWQLYDHVKLFFL